MSNNNNFFSNNNLLAELFNQDNFELGNNNFASLEFEIDNNQSLQSNPNLLEKYQKILQLRQDFLDSKLQSEEENDTSSNLLENAIGGNPQNNDNNPSITFNNNINSAVSDAESAETEEELDVLPNVSNDRIDFTNTGSENLDLTTASFDLSQTFFLNSNPGAKQVIYLDFDGHLTTNTAWNSYANLDEILTPAYDIDGNTSFFSNTELAQIQAIWQRVAEDFSPFDVNVTTQEVDLEALRRTNSSDTEWGVRVVVGGDNSWLGGGGGVAYLNSFNWNSDTPAFVFEDNLSNGNEKYVAEAISHEAGHSLGLEHDGNSTTTYYTGEGSGATGWAPIMGVGYYQELTQWSQGEYYDANNTEDDLSIITGNNGFGYRIDDHGDTNESATAMTVDGNTISANGIISQNTDYDVFSFSTGTGNVNLNILPAERGANLDILAELYDSSGTLIATSNPFESLNANFSLNLAAGQYYLSVTGTGKEGAYSDYGSLGQYSINGNVAIVENDFLSIEAIDAIKSEGNSDSTEFTFTVNRSGNITQETQVAWTVTGTGFDPVNSNDFVGGVLPGGIVQFAANQTSQTITVNIAGDTILENDETFFVSLNNPSANTIISVADAEGIIINDDFNNYVAPTISIDDVAVNENNGSAIFTVTRSGDLNDTVTLEYNTSDGKGKNGAKAGSDYIGDGGIITFNPGDSTVSLAVSLVNDTTSESNESFFVNLSNVSNNASISDFQGIATILNDDFSNSTTDSKGGGGRGGSKKKAPEFIIETSQIDDLTGSSKVDPFMLGSQDLFYETNLNNNNYQAIENIPFGEDFRELYGNGENNFANNSPFNSENTAIFAYDEAIDVVMA